MECHKVAFHTASANGFGCQEEKKKFTRRAVHFEGIHILCSIEGDDTRDAS